MTAPDVRGGFLPRTEAATVKEYVFEKSVKVNGKMRSAGDVVSEKDIPTGHLESLLRQGQVSEHVPGDLAAQFAAAMEAGPRGQIVTLPDGFQVERVGPTDEDMKAAVAEIEKLRLRCGELAVENKKLRDENELLGAELDTLEAEAKAHKAETEPTGEPEKKTDEKPAETKTESKAEPPKIGPAKPPELKAGGKK